MQVALPGILFNENNEIRVKDRLEAMKVNQQTIKNGLEGENYCKIGSSSGAMYATIVIDLKKFKPDQIENMETFCKLLYAEENVKIFPGEFFEG